MANLTYKTNQKTRNLVMLAMFSAITLLLGLTPAGYIPIGVVKITSVILPVAIGAIFLGTKGGAILGFVFGLTSFIQCFGIDPFGTVLYNEKPIFTIILCFVPRILMGVMVSLIFKGLSKLFDAKNNKLLYVVSLISSGVIGSIVGIMIYLLCLGNNVDKSLFFMRACIPFFTVLGLIIGVGLIVFHIKRGYKTTAFVYSLSSLSAALLNSLFFMIVLFLFFSDASTLAALNKEFNAGASSLYVLMSTAITFNAPLEAGFSLVVGGAVALALSKVYYKTSK
jgi:uncharacterized membrane protein